MSRTHMHTAEHTNITNFIYNPTTQTTGDNEKYTKLSCDNATDDEKVS